jgi:hypothetical protein
MGDVDRSGVGGGTTDEDPGAFIGQRPEREEASIPGGAKPGDQRVAAQDAAPGVPGEPESDQDATEFDRQREAGQNR